MKYASKNENLRRISTNIFINSGYNVIVTYYGDEIKFTDDTSWTEHVLKDEYKELVSDFNNKYLSIIMLNY